MCLRDRQDVIWNNIDLKKVDEYIEAFQLTSHVMDMLGMTGGVISKYHSTLRHSEDYEDYLEGLRMLEYDILYGDKEVYGGELPYSPTNLQMGHKNITIKKVNMAAPRHRPHYLRTGYRIQAPCVPPNNPRSPPHVSTCCGCLLYTSRCV